MTFLRKLAKFVLPYGLIEGARTQRNVRELGLKFRARDYWRSEWIAHELETTGLSLFPAGQLGRLRNVVDVGANVGQWSIMFLNLINPDRLVVIEPQPAAFQELQRLLGDRTNVRLCNTAIGATTGTTKFRVTRDTTGASILPPRDEMRDLIGSNWSVTTEIEVPLTTLDCLLVDLPDISLLKIDVQGFEKAVLAGAFETLQRTDFILIELNYMQQYEGGSWLGEIHEILTHEHPFVLVDASKPLRLNGRASMSDGLYVNPQRVPDFAKVEFV